MFLVADVYGNLHFIYNPIVERAGFVGCKKTSDYVAGDLIGGYWFDVCHLCKASIMVHPATPTLPKKLCMQCATVVLVGAK